MKYLVTILALMIVVPATALMAQDCRMMEMAGDLNLTDQQIEQMQKLGLAHQKEMVQYRADLEKARIEMHEIMMADDIDRRAAMQKSEQMSQIKANMASKRLEHRLDRLNILDKDQRAKVKRSMMKRRPGHRGCFVDDKPGAGRRGGCRDDRAGRGERRLDRACNRDVEVIIEKSVNED